ncbi:hypothetical protein PABG_04879 [Paracoccidioides brasiliensis Pb03]|nr:hypothetical protein PABG_04879 [Paracoccidioides brasiliensis Pb03]
MSSTLVPETCKASKLDEDNFVAFGHVAAGHDGVLCNPSGSLIAKPCTPQEIEFYESAPQHPGFWRFMPKFIGTLSNGTPQVALEIPGDDRVATLAADADPSACSSGTDTPLPPQLRKQSNLVAALVPATSNSGQEWVPSRGHKINTTVSIVLENIAAGFKRPSVLDVKLGVRLWADDSPSAKRDRLDQVSKETTSSVLGFRIAGMKVWVGNEGAEKEEKVLGTTQTKSHDTVKSKQVIVETVDGYRRYDKWYGRSLNVDNVKEGFEIFLAGAKAGKIDRSKLVARRLAEELRAIQAVLEAEESRMYSASVLIVYEGDPEALEDALAKEAKDDQNDKNNKSNGNGNGNGNDEESEDELELESGYEGQLPDDTEIDIGDDEDEIPHKVHDIRLIDFAHAKWTPGQGPDENALFGVRSLVQIMDEVAEV